MMTEAMIIWDREFNIDIVYDVYSGEEILPYQKTALESFLGNYKSLIDSSLKDVKNYCLENNEKEIGQKVIDNIFKYVIPKAIFIKRTKQEKQIVSLLCDYKFNPDDGLAIVFENNQMIEIGTQNIIL